MSTHPYINQYAGQLAREVNTYLRGEGGSNERYGVAVETIKNELNTLPPHNSQIVLAQDLYTGIPFEAIAVWFNKRIGEFIQFPNFLSSSMRDFNNAATVYRIATSSSSAGRDISKIVRKPGEAEVLFLPNTIFKITGVTEKRFVELEEVSEAPSPIVILREVFLQDEEVNEIYEHANNIICDENDIPSLFDTGEI
ncbi:ADP-ribosyltransferase domain-containing protein [Pontibacter sp. E15-1]|uniref:ADP-ribosyltransferase n=1 Tax=Pontibacter sp. E15-1 TaxID=2919918 RepID=UPI001F50003D|nr:ADP-ribosyltransferase [Pontibacter sp. E15-1]MCJ8164105.1 ADP-ribosyltransferase domain-containing protein [Pontibacter sp. E15-1]